MGKIVHGEEGVIEFTFLSEGTGITLEMKCDVNFNGTIPARYAVA